MSHTKDEYKMFTYLGQKIKNEALKDSACMEMNLREIIGSLNAYIEFSHDESLIEFIEPLKIMARYGWNRMEVTDLSLLLGENISNVSFKKRSEPRNDDIISEDLEEDI
jgi:hypothetical protein